MDKGKKRERNVNFSREETERLVSLVETNKDVIENKKSDAVTWLGKEQVWKDIEKEFNSSGTEAFRDAKHLKLKYEALKRDTRKKLSVFSAKHYKTGGGVNEAPPLTPVEQKVKEMILLSVDGGESIHDSDKLGKTRKKRPIYKLVEGKLDIVDLQKKIIEQELEEKKLKIQMLKNEIAHKNEVHKLVIEQMLLQIEILRTDLKNKNKNN